MFSKHEWVKHCSVAAVSQKARAQYTWKEALLPERCVCASALSFSYKIIPFGYDPKLHFTAGFWVVL